MKSQIISARRSTNVSSFRATDLPWTEDLRAGLYELSTGRKKAGGYFSKSSYAFACMVLRGTELSSLPWRFVNSRGKLVENHPLISMLTDFGPESNYAEAMIATEIDLLLCGQAFWLRDIDIIKRLNPTTIKVVKTRSGISEFTQTIEGTVVNRFPREEVTYFREYHPDDDLGAGVPVMEVIKKAVDTERECLLYINAFFRNDATPSLLLSTVQGLGLVALQQIKEWWNKTFRGVRKAHKVGVVDKGLRPFILSRSLKDNMVLEARDQARAEICVGMRVPKILIGDMEKATYANAQEARKFMIEDLIIPRSVYLEGVINHDLVQQVDSNVSFEFATSELPILQEDANLKWERLEGALERGVITPEFAAEQMGWPLSAIPTEVNIPSDLRSWQRKSLKAFKRNESANVPFVTDNISAVKQLEIRAQLALAEDIESVRRAFL